MASLNTKPTLVIVPGAWHSPAAWAPLIQKLEPLGYKCVAVALKAVATSLEPTEEPVKNLDDDIQNIRSIVLKELETNDVVVVSHSWSGMVASAALDGLSKQERGDSQHAVVKLAYITAFVPLEGISLQAALGGQPSPYWDTKGPWTTALTPVYLFYHDLPPAEAAHWVSTLRPHAYATKTSAASSCAWRRIPSAYLVCEDDHAIPVAVQDAMIQKCLEEGAQMAVERVFASHSPFLSQVEVVVGFLRRAAGETV